MSNCQNFAILASSSIHRRLEPKHQKDPSKYCHHRLDVSKKLYSLKWYLRWKSTYAANLWKVVMSRTQLAIAPNLFSKVILIANLIWNFLFEQGGDKILKWKCPPAKCISCLSFPLVFQRRWRLHIVHHVLKDYGRKHLRQMPAGYVGSGAAKQGQNGSRCGI